MKKKRNIFRHFFQIVRCLVLAFPLLHVCFNVVKNWVQDTKYDIVTITDTGEVAVSQDDGWGKNLSNAFVYSLFEEQFSTNLIIDCDFPTYNYGGFFNQHFSNAHAFCEFVTTDLGTIAEYSAILFEVDIFDIIFSRNYVEWSMSKDDDYIMITGFYGNPLVFTDISFNSIFIDEYVYEQWPLIDNVGGVNFESWVYSTWLNYYLNYLISLSVILLLPEFVLWFIDSVRNYGYKLSDKLD